MIKQKCFKKVIQGPFLLMHKAITHTLQVDMGRCPMSGVLPSPIIFSFVCGGMTST